MPRIELLPDDFDENSGDGSPFVDACRDCADEHFVEGEVQTIKEPPCLVGEKFEHPDYDDRDCGSYTCEVCNKELSEAKDG